MDSSPILSELVYQAGTQVSMPSLDCELRYHRGGGEISSCLNASMFGQGDTSGDQAGNNLI